MAPANAEDTSLVSDHSPAKLRDVEVILEVDLVGKHLIDIEEVDVL